MSNVFSKSFLLLTARDWRTLAFFVVGYLLTYAISIASYLSTSNSTVIWLTNGYCLGVLLVVSFRLWPHVLALITLLHFFLAYFVYSRPLAFVLLVSLGDMLEPALIAWAIRCRMPRLMVSFELRGAWRAAGFAVAGTSLGGLFGAAAVRLGFSSPHFGRDWLQWWMGNIVGLLLVSPVVVGWLTLDRAERRSLLAPGSLIAIAAFWAAAAMLAYAGFNDVGHDPLSLHLRSLFIVMLLAASVYFHPRIIASAVLLGAMILVANAVRGQGPFAHAGLSLRAMTLNIQLYLALAGLISLAVSALTNERRKTLRALRISESLYHGIVEDQTEFIGRCRPDLTVTFVNKAFCRHFPKRCEDIIGQSVLTLVPPEERERLRAHFASLSHRHPFDCIEHRLTDARGQERWHQWVNRAIFGPGGEIVEYQGVGRDVTDIKRADLALRAVVEATAEQVGGDFFRTLARQLALGLGMRYAMICERIGDHPGRVRTLAFWADDRFLENIEYDLKHTPCETVYDHQTCLLYNHAQRLFPQDSLLKSLGVESYIGAPFTDSSGRSMGHLLLMHDRPFTALPLAESLLGLFAVRAATELERTRVEQALRESSRRKDEFLAMLAHELRNPLAPIRNSVQILRTVGSDRPILQRQHEIIDRQVRHMAHLLDDLLDVSRITQGKIELKRQQLAVADVFAQAVETASPLIETRLHTLHLAPPRHDLKVEGDFDRLVQVVGNLLNNAAKYTDAGGEIWLEAVRQGDEAVIRVRDNGVGIPPEVLPHVFELFTQAERSLDRSQGGLGIGLTLAQQLVQMHGGRIEAHSEGAGKGSEFVIRLPALPVSDSADQDESPREPVSQAEFRTLRVLVVDDVIDTARSLAELLEIWGHQASVAYDGASTLAEVRSFNPDVVLLDIGLPGMDGYEVVRRLREEYGDALLIIALTGYGQEYDRQKAREAGFDEHMVKPIDLGALKRRLAAGAAH